MHHFYNYTFVYLYVKNKLISDNFIKEYPQKPYNNSAQWNILRILRVLLSSICSLKNLMMKFKSIYSEFCTKQTSNFEHKAIFDYILKIFLDKSMHSNPLTKYYV